MMMTITTIRQRREKPFHTWKAIKNQKITNRRGGEKRIWKIRAVLTTLYQRRFINCAVHWNRRDS